MEIIWFEISVLIMTTRSHPRMNIWTSKAYETINQGHVYLSHRCVRTTR